MRILFASSIDPGAIDELSIDHEVVTAFDAPERELIAAIAGCDVLVFRSGVTITPAVLEAAPALSLVLRAKSPSSRPDHRPSVHASSMSPSWSLLRAVTLMSGSGTSPPKQHSTKLRIGWLRISLSAMSPSRRSSSMWL